MKVHCNVHVVFDSDIREGCGIDTDTRFLAVMVDFMTHIDWVHITGDPLIKAVVPTYRGYVDCPFDPERNPEAYELWRNHEI